MFLLENVDNWKVYITVGVILVLAVVVCIMGYELDRREEHHLKHSVTPEFTSPLPSSTDDQGRQEDISVSNALTSVLSPYFWSTFTWRQRWWGEIKLHHPYVNLFLRFNREYCRPLRGLSLLLNILTVFCIQAVIFTNNRLCVHSSTQIECEMQWLTSWMQISSSVCYWDEAVSGGEGDHCSTRQIGGDFQLSLKIVLISAVLSIPVVFVFNWVIIYVLASDTKAVSVKMPITDEHNEGAGNDVGVNSKGNIFFNWRQHQQILQEIQVASTLGSSLTSEFGRFQQQFGMYLETKSALEIKDVLGAWKAASRKDLSHKIRKNISKIRRLTVKEMQQFTKNQTNARKINDRILFLFVKDVTSGITRQIINAKHRQEQMKKRTAHYLWKILGYFLLLSVIVGMVVYLYLFGRLQDLDRQQIWFFSALLWLGMDLVFFSTLGVIAQHIVVPGFITEDLKATIEHLFRGTMSNNYEVQSPYYQAKAVEHPFNAASFVFVSQRLALQYPQSVASRIILQYSTVWPRGSRHHRGDMEKTRSCCCVSVCLSFLSLLLYLPLLLQDSFFRFISTVLLGALMYVHIYLYNMFPALAACPLYAAILLWLIYLLYVRRKRNKVNARNTNTIIEVKPLDLEAGGGNGGGGVVRLQKKETSKKSVTFRVPDAESSGHVTDLNSCPSAVLSLMSVNMDNYERYIVQDVLTDAVTVVHLRGMDYYIDDSQTYNDNTKAVVEDTLTNLDSVMSVLEANYESSLEPFSRNSICSVHSITHVPNFNSKPSLSIEFSENISEEPDSRVESKLRTSGDGDGDGDDETFYPACQLEEDELTFNSQIRSSQQSIQVTTQGQSCELVSILIEEKASESLVEKKELELEVEFEFEQEVLNQGSVMSIQEKLAHHRDVEERQQEMLLLGAEAMHEQITHAHAAAQQQREMDMQGLAAKQEQIKQTHLEVLKQRAVDQERMLSQARHDLELALITSEHRRLEKEHAAAERQHTTEVQRVQDVLAATSWSESNHPKLSRTTSSRGESVKEEEKEEEAEEEELEVIDLLGVTTVQDFMKSPRKSSSMQERYEQEPPQQQEQGQGQGQNHEQEQEQEEEQEQVLKIAAVSHKNLLAFPRGEAEEVEPAVNITAEHIAAIHFVGTLLDKYLVLKTRNEGHKENGKSAARGIETSPLSPISSPIPADEYKTRKANKTTFYLSPPQKAKRKDKLLADAEKILTLSQLKKKNVTSNYAEDEADVDVDILPVFSAWCDDVFDELNSSGHKSRARKRTPTSSSNRKQIKSPADQSVKLYDYGSDSGDDTVDRMWSASSTPLHSPDKQQQQQPQPQPQQPNYFQAFALLNNPKYVTDLDVLQRILDSLGVLKADDLAELDDDDLGDILSYLKKVSLKKFNRFMCRNVRRSV